MDSKPISNPNLNGRKAVGSNTNNRNIIGVPANLGNGGYVQSYSAEELKRLQELANNPFAALNWLFSPNTNLKPNGSSSSVHSPLETAVSKFTDKNFWLDFGLIIFGVILALLALYVLMVGDIPSVGNVTSGFKKK